MKTTKLIIGIISIVLSLFIVFGSCAAMLGDALIDEGGSSGFSGMLVAIIMLVTGIVAIAARKSRGAAVFCTIAYALAGLLGILSYGIYKDLIIWGALCMIFSVIFLFCVIKDKKAKSMQDELQESQVQS